PGDQCKDFTDLLEAGLEQEVRVPAVALGAEYKKTRLRVAQRLRPLRGNAEAVRAGVFKESCCQAHRAQRGVALMDLQLAVECVVRRIADVGDQAIYLPSVRLPGTAGRDLKAFVRSGEVDGLDDRLIVELDIGIRACRDGVRPNGQAVALAQPIIRHALDWLRAGAACQPDYPGVG